ncbi:hypothetical protein ACQEVB_15550 [Pseudonocardia sp. CA-107938]|uniref:hypothetical protein n=1 Tax=Pseudonocardia sp. CA-107938 TaxID=3240021 RepID=UPI003D8E2E2D
MSAGQPDRLETFIDDVDRLVRSTDDEHELTARTAELLSDLLAEGYRLPPEAAQVAEGRQMTYPLHIAADGSWSMASVVWDVGQRTKVHTHETWGAVGVYSGAELEVRYVKPAVDAPVAPLVPAGEARWEVGQVTVCCTTDDDIHAVVAVGDEPTIGIHVYGADIGSIRRRSYDPATGEYQWFVHGWDSPTSLNRSGPALPAHPR